MLYVQNDIIKVTVVLLMISTAALGMYSDHVRWQCVLLLEYGAVMFINAKFVHALPVLAYELAEVAWKQYCKSKEMQGKRAAEQTPERIIQQEQERKNRMDSRIAIVAAVIIVVAAVYNYYRIQPDIQGLFAEILCVMIAVMLNVYCNVLISVKHLLIVTRDDSRELNMALKAKNLYLIEKQDAQIYTATLKERNRIAREIHDNVGHMLSRSIIQTGAAIAVNKQENLSPMLQGIKETLDGAMNNIRSSVHDLHDESIDLQHNITDIIDGMKGYHVNFEYDMSGEIPRNVKYCIISIVKEATANIVKHSNADSVDVILREHPAFYQMMISDNGKCIVKGDGTGIGVENMKERVRAFDGQIEIDDKNGYKIFVNIPKSTDNTDEAE